MFLQINRQRRLRQYWDLTQVSLLISILTWIRYCLWQTLTIIWQWNTHHQQHRKMFEMGSTNITSWGYLKINVLHVYANSIVFHHSSWQSYMLPMVIYGHTNIPNIPTFHLLISQLPTKQPAQNQMKCLLYVFPELHVSSQWPREFAAKSLPRR